MTDSFEFGKDRQRILLDDETQQTFKWLCDQKHRRPWALLLTVSDHPTDVKVLWLYKQNNNIYRYSKSSGKITTLGRNQLQSIPLTIHKQKVDFVGYIVLFHNSLAHAAYITPQTKQFGYITGQGNITRYKFSA